MFEKRILPNGVRILTEHVPAVRSVAAGIWVDTGSRYEKASENGASHFIEHMVFKGTEHRSAQQIAAEMDGIGGQINAFTTKECTCFYGRVLDTHLGRLTDVLCDMFFHSKFDEGDVQNERGVILEEIGMYDDTPDDLVAERLFAAVFKGSSLARPILGTKKTLQNMTGASLKAYKNECYLPSSTIVTVAGSFDDAEIDALAERFAAMEPGKPRVLVPASYNPAIVSKKKSTEQNHLCIAFPGMSLADENRYTMQLLNGILGGGMSSRLFQALRERHGLCYSVYTFGSSYLDTGVFSVYTALSGETEDAALQVLAQELRRFREEGVTRDELDRNREQAKANVLMSLESTGSRMNRLGRSELSFGRIPDIDEVVASYDAVTADDIAALAQQVLDPKLLSFSAVGKVPTADVYREKLAKLGF